MKKRRHDYEIYDEYVDPSLDYQYGLEKRYQFFLDIYESMIGVRERGFDMDWVEDAFAEGQLCAEQYEIMRSAYGRVCARLGVKGEDKDLDIMVEAMEKIQKELCRRIHFLTDDRNLYEYSPDI